LGRHRCDGDEQAARNGSVREQVFHNFRFWPWVRPKQNRRRHN
jgi:hypothetical protein